MKEMEWALLRAGIISLATLNTAPLISSPPQLYLQPLSRERSSFPSTLPSQSHPDSGVWQQNHLHTHKEQLFPLRESNPCLWDLAKMESKLGLTSRDNSICAVPADTCQEGNEKPSLGAMWLFS